MPVDKKTVELPIIRLPPKWSLGGAEKRTLFYQGMFVAFIVTEEMARFIFDILTQHEAHQNRPR